MYAARASFQRHHSPQHKSFSTQSISHCYRASAIHWAGTTTGVSLSLCWQYSGVFQLTPTMSTGLPDEVINCLQNARFVSAFQS
jgi:hypothetical protein